MMFLSVGISRLESVVSLLGVVIMFVLVLVISYVTTKWLGGTGLLAQRSKNISIVESYKLGPNKFIQIVKVGKHYYLLGIGKDTVEYLSEIAEEDLDLEQYMALMNKSQNPESFKDIFSKVNKKRCGDSEYK